MFKNERAMSFEMFSSKLQDTISTLEECDRASHDGDGCEIKFRTHNSIREDRLILQDIAA